MVRGYAADEELVQLTRIEDSPFNDEATWSGCQCHVSDIDIADMDGGFAATSNTYLIPPLQVAVVCV
jgi:hypothetical protein